MQKRAIQYKTPKSRKAEIWCPAQVKRVNVFFCQKKCGLYGHLYSLGIIICNWRQDDGAMDADALRSAGSPCSLRRDATC